LGISELGVRNSKLCCLNLLYFKVKKTVICGIDVTVFLFLIFDKHKKAPLKLGLGGAL
jgi:hypothetical protein